jgi:hypothetical protein
LDHVSALTGLTAWLDISAWTTVSRQQSGAFGRYDTMGVANHLAILLEIESPGACINRFPERRIGAREREPDRSADPRDCRRAARNWLPARPDKGRVWIPFGPHSAR